MEVKKQVLRVLGIGLMLSVISPVHAAEPQKLTRRQLYEKCIRGQCNEKEKAQVRADLKKAGKWAGALLVAAAVAIGATVMVQEMRRRQSAEKEEKRRQVEEKEWKERYHAYKHELARQLQSWINSIEDRQRRIASTISRLEFWREKFPYLIDGFIGDLQSVRFPMDKSKERAIRMLELFRRMNAEVGINDFNSMIESLEKLTREGEPILLESEAILIQLAAGGKQVPEQQLLSISKEALRAMDLPERESGTFAWFEVLKVPKTATREEIQRAFRMLAGKYHPDKHPKEEKLYTEIVKIIGEAKSKGLDE